MRVVICGGGVVGARTWPLLRLVHRLGARPTSQKVSRDRRGRQCFTDAWRPKSKGAAQIEASRERLAGPPAEGEGHLRTRNECILRPGDGNIGYCGGPRASRSTRQGINEPGRAVTYCIHTTSECLERVSGSPAPSVPSSAKDPVRTKGVTEGNRAGLDRLSATTPRVLFNLRR
jgi:hypothetical protein